MDAALLIETGYHKKVDKLIVVYASQKDQVKRLMERDRFTLEQAMARISSQMPLDEKRAYADYVIENTETREEAERQTREIFSKLKAEAGQRE
jgi:dephospho-CoA kinase